MYKRFFGFKERPFKLVPNPAYVYLSRIHEEALAHLNYAVNYGDGFVAITGEVGTGKTTLCRMFLESLDEKTEIAYIFNPKLDALQLLKAINDEFYIPTNTHGDDSVKSLIDNFNAFLLKKKAQGRRVILLVDEAQNLSADVLEQLRLLSNLETNSSKLLQIILVGQPELNALLETDRLRQLKQRITLSCHLVPLNSEETQEYIRHRIYIAATRPGVSFTMAACRSIFKHTGGVPRLINIVCDRALLIAFNLAKHRISKDIVKQAIKEVGCKSTRQWFNPKWFSFKSFNTKWKMLAWATILAGGGLVVMIFAVQALFGRSASTDEPVIHHKIEDIGSSVPVSEQKDTLPASPQPLNALSPALTDNGPSVSLSSTGPVVLDLQRTIAAMQDPFLSRSRALLAVLKAWNAPTARTRITLSKDVRDNEIFFRVTARRSDLETQRVKGTLNMIQKLNLPAILEFKRPVTGDYRFLAVVGFVDGKVRLSDSDTNFSVSPAALAALWNGVAYVLWKNFYHFEGVIPITSPGEVIIALKMHLKTLGFPILEMNAAYDIATRSAVETVQARHGLNPDGMVGPLTKIVLYNEDRSLDIPRLVPPLGE